MKITLIILCILSWSFFIYKKYFRFQKIVKIEPAFDKRDPDPKKNYGIGSCILRMVLKGPKGAVQFVLSLGMYLHHIDTKSDPMAYDVGYHSYKPIYEDQNPLFNQCEYLENKPCYYDGSGLEADRVYKEIFLTKGSDGIWEYLRKYYDDIFKRGSHENQR